MKLQVGDKVRFLNEAIEGVVSQLLSNSRVDVATADGFTMTAFENQLVKVEFEISLSHTQPTLPEVKEASQGGARESESAETGNEKKKVKSDPLLNSLSPDETDRKSVV